VAGAQERCSAGRRGAGARGAARQGGSVRNRGQARSRDTMRVEESWGRMRYLYCSTGGTIYRWEDPPRADGQGERRPGEAAALGVVTQPIRVRPAARGR
jgi:hypothetical protein